MGHVYPFDKGILSVILKGAAYPYSIQNLFLYSRCGLPHMINLLIGTMYDDSDNVSAFISFIHLQHRVYCFGEEVGYIRLQCD